MNSLFTVYDPSTGKIIRHGFCAKEAIRFQAMLGEAVIDRAPDDDQTQYIVNGEFATRPEVSISKTEIVADGVDVAVIDLGEPFVVVVNGETYEIEDGSLEFSTDMPGVYTLEIDHFPYMPFKQEVTAHAS